MDKIMDIMEVFERADVECYFDHMTNEVVFKSNNKHWPLTDIEKRKIELRMDLIGLRCRFE